MPLIQSKSKKAFSKNIEAEMSAGKPQKQSLAIAYNIKRKNSKKMAKGGEVEASTEKRPMPDDLYSDAASAKRTNSNKALKDADWTGRPTVEQAQRPSKTPLSQPKGRSLLGSDEEDDFIDSISPDDNYAEQPKSSYDEKGAKRQGPKVSDMASQHNNGRAAYAKGGRVKDTGAGLLERDDEADLMESAYPSSPSDQPKASYDESDDYGQEPNMADEEHPHTGETEPDMLRRHAMELAHFAQGGDTNPKLQESHMEPHEEGSIAREIMGKRKAMSAGGEVDLEGNSEEDLNNEDDMSFDAGLKEQYDLRQLKKQPMNSNQKGDSREEDAENEHDESDVKQIRSKMKKKAY